MAVPAIRQWYNQQPKRNRKDGGNARLRLKALTPVRICSSPIARGHAKTLATRQGRPFPSTLSNRYAHPRLVTGIQKKHHLADVLLRLFLYRSFQDKSPHGRQSRTRTEHDHGHCRIRRRMESDSGRSHGELHSVSRSYIREVV
jgi:hypothetical protein